MSTGFIPINPAWLGMTVYSNPICVQKIPMPTLIDKVLAWNPCNNFPVTAHEEPTAFIAGNNLIAHPVIVENLRNYA